MNAKNLFMEGVEPLLMSTLGKIMKKNRESLKITQNVAFEFLNFGIFHQFLTY